jgi:hypothetical protein
MRKHPTFPYNYPEGSCICHVLSGNVCLQHRFLGFANETTVKELLAFPHHFGICDHQHNVTGGSNVAAIWMGVSRTSAIQP